MLKMMLFRLKFPVTKQHSEASSMRRPVVALVLLIATALAAQQPPEKKALHEGSDYVVEQPGTITFTHGIVIVGKVEKPQVMIFLPKEKSYYRDMSFSRSFAADIAEPLAFEPVTE